MLVLHHLTEVTRFAGCMSNILYVGVQDQSYGILDIGLLPTWHPKVSVCCHNTPQLQSQSLQYDTSQC